MMSDTKFVDFDAQAHEKATNALGSLPGNKAPQIGDGVMRVEYVKTDDHLSHQDLFVIMDPNSDTESRNS